MAKVPFTKLKCKINTDEIPVQIGEETIVVKQYLPIQDKLGLISRVIELAHDQDYNYSNPVKIEVYIETEVIFAYTNISFTDKQKEDLPKLYDVLKSSGIIENIIKHIPETEINTIYSGVWRSVESIYQYQNSVLGLLDTIKTDYSNMKLDIDSLNNAITNPETLSFVKSMLTNLN